MQTVQVIARSHCMRLAAVIALPLLCETMAAEPSAPVVIFPPDLMGAQLFAQACAVCHGPKGEGNVELSSPSIARQPAYYVRQQLRNFRENRRGTDPTDAQGVTMAAIAKLLQPDQIESVARHIETMPRVSPDPLTVEGADLKEGRWLYEMRCMECHRFNASGELAFGSPPLLGLQGWYLISQMQKFKNGQRGTAAGDVNGAKMVFAAGFIENDQVLRDIVGYILSLNPAPASGHFEPSGR